MTDKDLKPEDSPAGDGAPGTEHPADEKHKPDHPSAAKPEAGTEADRLLGKTGHQVDAAVLGIQMKDFGVFINGDADGKHDVYTRPKEQGIAATLLVALRELMKAKIDLDTEFKIAREYIKKLFEEESLGKCSSFYASTLEAFYVMVRAFEHKYSSAKDFDRGLVDELIEKIKTSFMGSIDEAGKDFIPRDIEVYKRLAKVLGIKDRLPDVDGRIQELVSAHVLHEFRELCNPERRRQLHPEDEIKEAKKVADLAREQGVTLPLEELRKVLQEQHDGLVKALDELSQYIGKRNFDERVSAAKSALGIFRAIFFRSKPFDSENTDMDDFLNSAIGRIKELQIQDFKQRFGAKCADLVQAIVSGERDLDKKSAAALRGKIEIEAGELGMDNFMKTEMLRIVKESIGKEIEERMAIVRGMEDLTKASEALARVQESAKTAQSIVDRIKTWG